MYTLIYYHSFCQYTKKYGNLQPAVEIFYIFFAKSRIQVWGLVSDLILNEFLLGARSNLYGFK